VVPPCAGENLIARLIVSQANTVSTAQRANVPGGGGGDSIRRIRWQRSVPLLEGDRPPMLPLAGKDDELFLLSKFTRF